MLWLDYLTRFHGWELRLWLLLNGGRGVDDTLANSVTIFRTKLTLYVGLPVYLMSTVAKEPRLVAIAISVVIVSGLLDLIDGFLAKLFGTSDSGKRLDPAGDFINALVAFVIILGEHRFEFWLTVPAVGVTVLGGFIFALRVASGVQTHLLARATIGTMYAGAVALFIAIAATHKLLPETTAFGCWIAGTSMGQGFFLVGLVLMAVSTLVYASRALPQIRLRPILGMSQLT